MARYDETTIKLAENIKARRIELGMTQDELAKKCGFRGRSSITRIEKGGNAVGADLLYRLANALDTTAQELLGITGDVTTADVIRNLIGELTPSEQETVLKMIKGLINSHYEEE